MVAYEPERVVIEVDAPRPGYLVLTDSYYPGWQAMVDRAATTILRANGFFRAVALDEPQRVEFVSPEQLGWGALAPTAVNCWRSPGLRLSEVMMDANRNSKTLEMRSPEERMACIIGQV